MNLFFYISLFLLGTLFWSFASVIIYRFKSWEKGIITWRSHCWKCNKVLDAIELIPIVSWVISKWKCFTCKKQISKLYPLLELSMWALFALIWYFLIDIQAILNGNILEIIKLFFWLVIAFITIVYTYYDILFLEIHEWTLKFWIWFIFLFLSAQTLFPSFYVINTLPSGIENLSLWIVSIVLTFIIIWTLYTIMLRELHELVDSLILVWAIVALFIFQSYFWVTLSSIPILSWVIWALWIFLFFFIQIVLSWWKWMWWWDLRIAIIVWLILWVSLSFAWVMLTYFVWSIIGIWYIIKSKIINGWKSSFNSQVPFWPFLAIWFFTCVFFQNELINFIEVYFSNM